MRTEAHKVIDKQNLVPGQLYRCFTVQDDIDGKPEQRKGALVWYSVDGLFYNAESGNPEVSGHYADYWMPQPGSFNTDYAPGFH